MIEVAALGINHAEPLARGRLHNDPATYIAYAPGAKVFQASHFRLDIIGFNIQMHTAGMIDLLYRSNGKYFVADYKSNFLGYSSEQYTEAHIEEAMQQHYCQYSQYLQMTELIFLSITHTLFVSGPYRIFVPVVER